MLTGKFFAVDRFGWVQACDLGMNPALAYLVLACGTGADNRTTAWSAKAVSTYTGIAWPRARIAINQLETAGLSTKGSGKKPRRKLPKPDDPIWLPTSLVCGIGDVPPAISRLRQTHNVAWLRALVLLYADQNLAADGGLPRGQITWEFERVKICDRGQFTVWGFLRGETCFAWHRGAFKSFAKDDLWPFIRALESMGLLESVDYVLDGADADAEPLCEMTQEAHDACAGFARSLPGGFSTECDKYHYVVPVLTRLQAVAMARTWRLVQRPHTRMTAAWWAEREQRTASLVAICVALDKGDYQEAMRRC